LSFVPSVHAPRLTGDIAQDADPNAQPEQACDLLAPGPGPARARCRRGARGRFRAWFSRLARRLWTRRLRRRPSLGGQQLIGRSDSLERLFGSTVAGVSVGVAPQSCLPKGPLELGRRRTLREAKCGMGFATIHC
jgi:hypothetical protein